MKTPGCCKTIKNSKNKGFLTGLLYGILPHTFCILFILFFIVGATSATFLFKKFLLNKNLFYYLILLSFLATTITAIVYLLRHGFFSRKGIKESWRYLLILYTTTTIINLVLFLVVFPATANFSFKSNRLAAETTKTKSLLTLKVAIPCSGHASLIVSEVKKAVGVEDVKFRLPNIFDVYYDASKINKSKILDLNIFQDFKATVAQ